MGDEQRAVYQRRLAQPHVLCAGALGIDAGLTLTKYVRATDDDLELVAFETAAGGIAPGEARVIGVTGARADGAGGAGAVKSQEIEAAARGALALLAHAGLDVATPFVLALLGTGTAFAAVRDGRVSHLGGTPLGGGSFAGIARRVEPALTYEAMIARAGRGDRRNVDVMISDAYPGGIGRVGPDLTAAHLARALEGSLDDFLAGLLNLHGENIAQIGASRALVGQLRRLVLAGGFVQDNPQLVASITAMAGMFGVAVDTVPAPGFAGALGAALIAAEAAP